jgi:hypothetical protein
MSGDTEKLIEKTSQAKRWMGARVLLFTVAVLMSVALSVMSILIVLFFVDLQHPKAGDLSTAALLFLGPILSAPAFAFVFISQRWHRCLMWLLAFATFTGTYLEIREGIGAWGALRAPTGLALLAIAFLVEISYQLGCKPKQASNDFVAPE